MGQSKRCEVCGQLKPVEDFSKSYKNRCKKCVASMSRMRRDSCSEKKAEEYRKIMETPDPIADNFLIDWEQRRYELAKSAMQGYCIALGINDDSETYDDIAIGSLRVADALIKKLKGK